MQIIDDSNVRIRMSDGAEVRGRLYHPGDARLSEQCMQAEDARRQGLQLAPCLFCKSWLRASHRQIDATAWSTGSHVHAAVSDMVGEDTIRHGRVSASHLLLSVLQ